ncbi:hypothetical protein ABZ917_40030 [Nonomuraea wenchangensis]
MAMFGGSVFLGQYFQIGRGYSPTEAGLLNRPGQGGRERQRHAEKLRDSVDLAETPEPTGDKAPVAP